MDRQDSKKRGREETEEGGRAAASATAAAAELSKKRKKKKQGKRGETTADVVLESCRVDVTDSFRPPGLFEFPWQKGERLLVPEPDAGWEWDLRDVFFSSLVDGCSAAIGVPGDRLYPTAPRPFCLLEEPPSVDGEIDGGGGGDCIWGSVLRQPLSAVHSKSCNA